MKNTLYIIVSLILFTSCNSQNNLEGIWFGAYKIEKHEKTTTFSPNPLLLDISKDSVVLKTFDFSHTGKGTGDSLHVFNYSIIGNKLIFDKDTFLIKGITKDSLILGGFSEKESDFVFKKLPEKKRVDINLENKAFSLTGPNYADSIDFINDSLFLSIGNVFNTNRVTRWAINSYKTYSFLVFDQIQILPFLIDKSSGNEIFLKLFFTTIRDFKLSPLDFAKDTNGIIGIWVWPFSYQPDLPLPPSPPDYPFDGDTRKYVRIRSDSLELEQYGRVSSKKWLLNSTKEYIYFPDELRSKAIWKIISVDENHLQIERNKGHHGLENRERIRFEKKENLEK